MSLFVGLLRAVNVGGTGKLAMGELRDLCVRLGFEHVRTYIQSGNVVFESDRSEADVQVALEQVLGVHMGTHIDVVVRDAEQLRHILQSNPFTDAEPSKVAVAFSGAMLPPTVLEGISAVGGEETVVGVREIYVRYPDGMGRSKLRLPRTAGPLTVRNITTVGKLVTMTTAAQ